MISTMKSCLDAPLSMLSSRVSPANETAPCNEKNRKAAIRRCNPLSKWKFGKNLLVTVFLAP